ncbi:hypothetical protein [Peribacillus butanolivorans]|uniref:hypothetical protein n=1 Tax=Peribacillus butanolivorans TaxID=421767 RepID=UPI0015966E44|nr:hypothetical protein [Peribacillus butanolivorans]
MLRQVLIRTGAILYELQSVERSEVQKGISYGYQTRRRKECDFASYMPQTIRLTCVRGKVCFQPFPILRLSKSKSVRAVKQNSDYLVKK